MYTTGWGFHTDWEHLVKAAYVWRAIRPLRLVRIRHAKQLASGTARVNLASLPAELFQIIENDVVEATQTRLDLEEPFMFRDGCCFDAQCKAAYEDPYYDMFLDFAVDREYDLEDDDDYLRARDDFDETAEGQALIDACMDAHEDSGECVRLESSVEFWYELNIGGPFDCCTNNDIEMILNLTEEAVQTLINDYNLELCRRSDEGYGFWAESPVSLLFDGTTRHQQRLTRSITSYTATEFSHSKFEKSSKLVPIKLLSPPAGAAEAESSLEALDYIKWMTLEEVDDEEIVHCEYAYRVIGEHSARTIQAWRGGH